MTVDPALLKDAAYFCGLVLFQVYNSWKHAQNAARITTNRDSQERNYAELHADFQSARDAIDRMGVTIAGGAARPSTVLSPIDAAQAAANGFGQRWSDPRTPRPPDAPKES